MKVRLTLAAAAVVFVGMLTAMPASAQYVGGSPPAAGPVAGPKVVQVQGQATPVNVQVGRTVRVSRFALTGADIAQMVLVGGVFLVAGAFLVRQGRRRPTPRIS